MHLGEGFAAQGAHIGVVGSELGRVLFSPPCRHRHQLGSLAQADGVGQDCRMVKNGRHEPVLVIHQHQLGFGHIDQHAVHSFEAELAAP